MTKHNTIVPKKRGRPVGSKNKPKPPVPKIDHRKTTTITASCRLELETVRDDIEARTGLRLKLRHIISYLCDSYNSGSFK
jgi:hypothetical protein